VASRKRRRAAQIGIPVAVIGVLTFVALWRVGIPTVRDPGESAAMKPAALPPVDALAEVLLPTSIGRRASLEGVRILSVPSARTLWVGADAVRVFVVLDPDVKQSPDTRLAEGARVTLIGLVRRPPAPADAMREWFLDAETAETVRDGGIYLYVTEVVGSR
jgi:hypothetical protein